MKARTNQAVSTSSAAAEAWDLYCEGSFGEILSDRSGERSPELDDLRALAALETGHSGRLREQNADAGVFTALRQGMTAYHDADFEKAAELLGHWLLEKDYYADHVLERFTKSALNASHYPILEAVCRKFLPKATARKLVVEPFFACLYQAGRDKDAVTLFEKFREMFNEPVLLQKAALALLRLGRNQDAEQILIPLYKKLTGMEYRLRYDEIRAEYSETIRVRESLAKKKDRSSEETMELGMAFLFNGEYERALRLFQSLLA